MTLPYCKNFAERAVAVGVQTVMVTDVMQRFSDNFNTFVLDLESMNLEIAVVTSAVDVSGHETNIHVLQGTTVMTISLTQYSPWAMCKKRAFDIVVSLIALLVSAIVSVPVAIAIKLTDGGPIFYMQTRVGLTERTYLHKEERTMRLNIRLPIFALLLLIILALSVGCDDAREKPETPRSTQQETIAATHVPATAPPQQEIPS